MPCSAFSAVCLRSSSIQPCSTSTIISSWHMPPFSVATASSHLRTAGSLPRVATKRGRARRAYGNSTSFTNEMLLVVPSMSVRIARMAMDDGSMFGRAWVRAVDAEAAHPRYEGTAAVVRDACRKRRGRRLARLTVLRARQTLDDVGAGEMADPAVRLGEEADRDEARFRAHVEPVLGAVGHGDQVAPFALHLVHLAVHVQREQA